MGAVDSLLIGLFICLDQSPKTFLSIIVFYYPQQGEGGWNTQLHIKIHVE